MNIKKYVYKLEFSILQNIKQNDQLSIVDLQIYSFYHVYFMFDSKS